MVFWKAVIDLGHAELMFPLAAAIATSLLAGRSWKLALCWCILFATGTSLVALSKIAFLGWDTGIPALRFKALSGHAFCASAVLPVFLFMVSHNTAAAWRIAAVAAGWVASAGIGWLMVHFAYHSASEVLGGLMLGAAVSGTWLHSTTSFPAPRWRRQTVLAGMLVFVVVFSLRPALVNHRLVELALQLSGRGQSHGWHKRTANTALCKVQLPSTDQVRAGAGDAAGGKRDEALR